MDNEISLTTEADVERLPSVETSLGQSVVSSSSPPNSPLPLQVKTKTFPVDVILPDSTLKQLEIDTRANGQDCLDKILGLLGIFEEVDYFGFTFHGAKQEVLWVNMRNRLVKQISGSASCRLHLRVKFFVHPHMLLQEETRHLFYQDLTNTPVEDVCWMDELPETQKAELIAYLAQAEFGDFNVTTMPMKYQKFWRSDTEIPPDVISQVAEVHRSLVGYPRVSAENHIVRMASKQPMYGMHIHEVKDCYDNKMNIAVGPSAICLCRENRQVIDRYPYPRVQKVTISDRVLYLSLSQENGSVKEVGYRLVSQRSANGLYRCVTEMHSFFRCDTVRSDVSGQTCRDIKGTLVSFFMEHEGGIARDFVFDIRRTAREVYDDSRRRLHRCSSAATTPTTTIPYGRETLETAFPFDFNTAEDSDFESSVPQCCRKNSDKKATQPPQQSVAELREQIASYEMQHQCNICMDEAISVVFIPCGHLVSCKECSTKVSTCPVCRVEISLRQTCFAPWSS